MNALVAGLFAGFCGFLQLFAIMMIEMQDDKGKSRTAAFPLMSEPTGHWACDFARRFSARPGLFIRRRWLVPNLARLICNVSGE